MITIYNIVPGPAGAPAGLLPQPAGAPPAHGGGQLGVHVFWIPNVPAPQAQEAAHGLIQVVYTTAMHVFSTFRAVFNDVNARSDFLKLIISITDLCETSFPTPSLRIFAHAFKASTAINAPVSLFNRFFSIVSNEAGTQEPFENHYDWLRIGSKMLFLVSDAMSSIRWLEEIGAITKDLVHQIGEFRVFECTTLAFINTASIVFSTTLDLFDNLRLVWKYAFVRDDTPAAERTFKLITYSLDILIDICRIATTILGTLPFHEAALAKIAVSCLGNSISLVKFFITEHTKNARQEEKASIERKKAGALSLLEHELGLAALSLHHAATSQENIRLLAHVMEHLGRLPGRIQRQSVHALALEALAQAIALSPAAPPLPPAPAPGVLLSPLAPHQLIAAWTVLQIPLPPAG